MAFTTLYNIAKGLRNKVHWSELIALGALIFSKVTNHKIFTTLYLPAKHVDIITNFLIFLLIIDNFRQITEFIYRQRKEFLPTHTDNLIIGLTNIYWLVIAGALLSTVLSLFGLSFTAFFTSISIVAAALAVLSKDYVGSIISGMILAFSEEVSVGDYVEIGTNKGKVIDMNLSRLVILSDDDEVIYVPNNNVFNSNIVNHSKRSVKKTTIEFELEWRFIKSVEEFERILIANISEYHDAIMQDTLRLSIMEIKHNFIHLKFQYILKEPNRDIEKSIRRKIQRKIVMLIRNTPEM